MGKLGFGGIALDFRPIAVLTLICIASAASLGALHSLTEEKIEESERRQVNQALSKIFPSSELEEVENNVYKALENGGVVGYAGIARGRGYGGFTGGFIKLAVGVNLDGKIREVRIIKQSETPGLGSRITENWFLNQFEGISVENTVESVRLVRDNGKIEAITGATISSSAVVDIVRKEVKKLRSYLPEAEK